MAYQTYTTKALVCGSYTQGTADKAFLLFTREAGMLFAVARSVREERSRQRYALQEFSSLQVALIKGKQGWRIGSVVSEGSLYPKMLTREARGVLSRLIKYLRRYVVGEVPDPAFYDEMMGLLIGIATVPPEHLTTYELFGTLRILARLGYVAVPPPLLPFLEPEVAWADALPHAGAAEVLIAQAESASHL